MKWRVPDCRTLLRQQQATSSSSSSRLGGSCAFKDRVTCCWRLLTFRSVRVGQLLTQGVTSDCMSRLSSSLSTGDNNCSLLRLAAYGCVCVCFVSKQLPRSAIGSSSDPVVFLHRDPIVCSVCVCVMMTDGDDRRSNNQRSHVPPIRPLLIGLFYFCSRTASLIHPVID